MPIYDRAGRPISALRWGELAQDPDYRILGETRVADVRVSTIWLGIDLGLRDGPPQIFESMIFWDDDSLHSLCCRRYTTEATAIAGHDQLVAAVRDTLSRKLHE